MHSMTYFYQIVDSFFIWPFLLPENAYAGFAFGLIWLALTATVIGELSMGGAYLLNRRHLNTHRQNMVRNFNLSLKALAAKDKASYKACNDLANDAFGKSFFSGITLFAASVWPAFLALGWLDFRFGDVEFPFPIVGEVGPSFYFVTVYILVRIVFARSKPWIPVFSALSRRVKADDADGEKMMTYMDLLSQDKK